MMISPSRVWQGHANLTVERIRSRFRNECVAPFFTPSERSYHLARHHNNLTPTLGFEAVVHALYACKEVHAFGFYIEPRQLLQAAAAADAVLPYHYWEREFEDKVARQPAKPWTFPSHNYELESKRLLHMAEEGCLLDLVLPSTSLVKTLALKRT